MVRNQTAYIACFNLTEETASQLLGRRGPQFHFLRFSSLSEFLSVSDGNRDLVKAVIVEQKADGDWGKALCQQLQHTGYGHLPVTIVAAAVPRAKVSSLLQAGIAEIFLTPLQPEVVTNKLKLILNSRRHEAKPPEYQYRIPLSKRLFDIVMASLALLFLSPVFLLVAALIRLESKGPVFYYSLRVGTGYRIFRFYKFRSMAVDADKKLGQLKHLNQYATEAAGEPARVKQLCDACASGGKSCTSALFADDEMWCEKLYKEHLQAKGQQAFMKIKDDPRITTVGKFIRNTSIDELPQLWNVLKGDMSLVGNRPLPLYEAEKLTTDKYALRFMAPAGITGLWQVSKRGKGKMSEEERISLDNDYARSYGLLFDIKLLLRTIPALLQKENV